MIVRALFRCFTRDRSAVLITAALILFCLPACAGKDFFRDGRTAARETALAAGFSERSFLTGAFVLTGYARPGPGDVLTVYIEGDGNSWFNRRTPSTDPTPENCLTLRLAAADPSGKVLYLGRPCQYLPPKALESCPMQYWTSGRYAPEVVDSLSAAVDEAKAEMRARRVRLVGYSGGGTLAALLAASREDVEGFISVGGNLDVGTWVAHHDLTPLTGSLDPADMAVFLKDIPQTHFSGARDRVAPTLVAESYMKRLGETGQARLVVVDGMGHGGEWVERWPELLREYAPWNAGVEEERPPGQ